MKHSILITAAAIFLMQFSASAADKVLASFATKDAVKAWNSVNDGVMGGVSTGGASWTEQGTLLFSGELSLANNGGFASIRTEPRSLGLAGSSAIVVKARGDGRTYSIELRVAGQMGASSYRADLPTSAGQWQETRISLGDFKPQAFGRALPFKPVNPANVDSIGFTLADKKAGPFKLEIESVLKADLAASNGLIHVIDQVLVPAKPTAEPLSAMGLIERAIELGVPLFNHGDPAAFAAVYEITCEALRVMPEVAPASRQTLTQALTDFREEKSARKQAWILRDALDRVAAGR
jgi:NADH dehydrogenase [ubiquinone] 1 alpha subcomplex assembly factor 1